MFTEIKKEANKILKANFGKIVIFTVIVYAIKLVSDLFLPDFVSAIVNSFCNVTYAFGMICVVRNVSLDVSYIGEFLTKNFLKILVVILIMFVFEYVLSLVTGILFLGSAISLITLSGISLIGEILLLILVYYIYLGFVFINFTIVDFQNYSVTEIISSAWNMMKGIRLEYITFELSFILWYICQYFLFAMILTDVGTGVSFGSLFALLGYALVTIYFQPYLYLSRVIYYDQISAQ